MEQCELKSKAAYNDASAAAGTATANLIGESEAMCRVRALIDRVASTEASVVIVGESGTGKELAAHAVHAGSARAERDFHAVNCGAIPATLIEAELFGCERGSFTGATHTRDGIAGRADGGTLFLDEIAEMPLAIQPPLLRFVETRNYFRVGGTRELHSDVRFIAATNRSPAEAIREHRLREDLYYRLAVVPIEIPPLRERAGDIVELAELFLARLNADAGASKRYAAGSLTAARRHDWPGNVRELKHAVECAFILGDGWVDLAAAIGRPANAAAAAAAPIPSPAAEGVHVPIGARLADVERSVIEATLDHFAGNKRRAARVLGCSVKTLYNKLNQYARLAGQT